jgi:hypothetical protein
MSRRVTPRPLTTRPTVSVVIPCYNYGHYLPVALTSVLSQPGVDVEAIVIDDCSPDGSASVVRALAAADARVVPILHAVNRGHIATYNDGLERATGDYVVLLSADDALTPGALERATALLEAEPGVSFAYGFPVAIEDELTPVSDRVRGWTVWEGREWIARRCATSLNCIFCPEVVLRAGVQRAIGGYDPALPHSGDLEMWMRAAAVGDVGRVNGPAQAYYRVHQSSMQRTTFAGHVNDLEGRRAAFEKVLVGPAAHVDRGGELYAVARRALAISALGYARLAHDEGRVAVEPVDEYLAFAERVWPESRSLRQWRTVQRRRRADPERLRRRLAVRGRRVATDLGDRIAWRRWRRFGV